MAYEAKIYNVMIASPGDVELERSIVRDVVADWNAANASATGKMLQPVGWETHSAPDMGDRPQSIINKQVLQQSDLLVAVFWTRLGTPTGVAPSGTVEEIEEHVKAGKPAMIYFSNAPVRPDSVEEEQYKALKDFRKECQRRGLIETYENQTEFRNKFARHLATILNTHSYFADSKQNAGASDFAEFVARQPARPNLTKEAQELLVEASRDATGQIVLLHYIGGVMLQTHNRQFIEGNNPRSRALWEGALDELRHADLVKMLGHKGEIFQLTRSGYELAETLGK
jgi:hypothetical protein